MIKWKKTADFSAISNQGHKLLKTLPHTENPIYNVFDKAGKLLGTTTDKSAINPLINGE